MSFYLSVGWDLRLAIYTKQVWLKDVNYINGEINFLILNFSSRVMLITYLIVFNKKIKFKVMLTC